MRTCILACGLKGQPVRTLAHGSLLVLDGEGMVGTGSDGIERVVGEIYGWASDAAVSV